MATPDFLDTLPAWQKALIAKKREERRKLEEMPAWKRELLNNKKRISDTVNYLNTGQSNKSIKTSHATSIEPVPMGHLDSNYNGDHSDSNCVNGHDKDVNMQRIGNDDMLLDAAYREGKSLAFSQNPFIRSFGLKLQRKHSREHIEHNEVVNGVHNDNLSSDDSFITDYHPGSGFVHKILDKFASLTVKEDHAQLCDAKPHDFERSHSKLRTNSVDRYSPSHDDIRRRSSESRSPKLSNEELNKRSSDPSPVHSNSVAISHDLHYGDTSGSDHEILSPTTHEAIAEMTRGRDDLVIIEKSDSLNTSSDSNLSFTVTRELTQPSVDELPKPNTVSSFRDLFESSISKSREEELRLKSSRGLDHAAGYKFRIRQDSLTPSDSSADNSSPRHACVTNDVDVVRFEQSDTSVDESESDDVRKDAEKVDVVLRNHNELYDTIRSKLRHVRPSSETEEIRYSWRNGGDDVKNESISATSELNSDLDCSENSGTIDLTWDDDSLKSHIEDIPKKVESIPQPLPRKSKFANNNLVRDSERDDAIVVTKIETISENENDNIMESVKTTSSILKPVSNTITTKVDVHNNVSDDAKTERNVEVKASVGAKVTEIDLDEIMDKKSPPNKPLEKEVIKQPLQRLCKTKTGVEPKYTPPKVAVESPPKETVKMQNVSIKTSTAYTQPNRFMSDDDANQTGFIDAGKSMFFQAGKFQANREPRKIQKKRKAPKSPVTVINLTNDMLIHGHSAVIPVSNIDESTTENVIPPLDLSNITDDSDDDEYQEGYIPTVIKPCSIQFIGAGVISGKSSLGRRSGSNLKIQFDDTATVTFEYPSEEWMREEIGEDRPTERGDASSTLTTLSLAGFDGFNESSDGPIPFIDEDDEEKGGLPSARVSTLTNSTGGLSSYKSRFVEDYEFGQEFQRQAEREMEMETIREKELEQTPSHDEMQLRQGGDADMITFSDTTAASDILF